MSKCAAAVAVQSTFARLRTDRRREIYHPSVSKLDPTPDFEMIESVYNKLMRQRPVRARGGAGLPSLSEISNAVHTQFTDASPMKKRVVIEGVWKLTAPTSVVYDSAF